MLQKLKEDLKAFIGLMVILVWALAVAAVAGTILVVFLEYVLFPVWSFLGLI